MSLNRKRRIAPHVDKHGSGYLPLPPPAGTAATPWPKRETIQQSLPNRSSERVATATGSGFQMAVLTWLRADSRVPETMSSRRKTPRLPGGPCRCGARNRSWPSPRWLDLPPGLPGIFIHIPGYSSAGTISRLGRIIVARPGTQSGAHSAKKQGCEQHPKHQERQGEKLTAGDIRIHRSVRALRQRPPVPPSASLPSTEDILPFVVEFSTHGTEKLRMTILAPTKPSAYRHPRTASSMKAATAATLGTRARSGCIIR